MQNLNYKTLSQEIANYKNTPLYTKGVTLYKKCIVCHGNFGEKSALNISKPINRVTNISEKLNKYKNGTLNQYGEGPLMQSKLLHLSALDMSTLSIYIQKLSRMYTLKEYKTPTNKHSVSAQRKNKIIYTCAELSETEAYSLLHMGHTYLDKDGDGNPCEWGVAKKNSSYSSNCSYVREYYRKNGTYVHGYMRCR